MLESYITPLLMSYVDKYIKNLKPSDLSLSLWGGDVVLYNLELRLDVLEKELNLPITFLSGKIHKLQIHIPWTKLGSEPVEITINTLECIVQLRYPDSPGDQAGKVSETSSTTSETQNEEFEKALDGKEEAAPSGYVQSLVNRVINNVSICVNNVILKYLEDDIVLSLNIKSAETFSVNSNWEKAFVDVVAPDFLLQKLCNISDLTVCLDKRNSSGKIELYQDPLLYKCGLSCRMLLKYDSLLRPLETKLNVYCESADISLTDQQLPMFIRLTTLCLSLYYGSLDLPGCNYKPHPAKRIVEQRTVSNPDLSLPSQTQEATSPTGNQQNPVNDEDWVNWMWSLVPNLADDQPGQLTTPPPIPLLLLGFYISQVTVTIKLTGRVSEGNFFGGQRFEFKPVLSFELSGGAAEIIMKGDEFFDTQFGVSSIMGWNIGDCVCGCLDTSPTKESSETDEREDMFITMVSPKEDSSDSSGFLRGSLFDNTERSSLEIPELTFDSEEFLKTHNESLALRRYGAFFLDYLYTMEIEPERNPDSENDSEVEGLEVVGEIRLVKELSFKRMIIGPTHVRLSSSMLHRMELVLKLSFEEIVPRKEKSEPFYDEFIEKQLLAGNIPSRHLGITLVSFTATLPAADHGKMMPGPPLVNTSSNTELHAVSSQLSLQSIQDVEDNDLLPQPVCIVQISRVDFQTTQPMYPTELTKLTVSNAEYPAGKAMLMCAYIDMSAQVFGIQVNLTQLHSDAGGVPLLNIIPPFSVAGSSRTCILPETWGGAELLKKEGHLEVPSWQILVTKPQFVLLSCIAESWSNGMTKPGKVTPVPKALIDSVFYAADQEAVSVQPELQFKVLNIEMQACETQTVIGASGSVGAVAASFKSTCASSPGSETTPLVEGPSDTSEMYTGNLFRSTLLRENIVESIGPVLSFTLQVPQAAIRSGEPVTQPGPPVGDHMSGIVLLHLKGITLSLDPRLYKWISYKSPATKVTPRHKAERERTKSTRHQTLTRTPSATTPKKKSFARGYGSVASPAKEEKITSNKNDSPTKQSPPSESTQEMVDGRKMFESWLFEKLPFITAMELQVELKSVTLFLPERHIIHDITTSDIALNYSVQSLKTTNNSFPPTLVISLPNFKLHSANHKPMSVRQSLPVKIHHRDATRRETLPWTLQAENLAVYSVHVKKNLSPKRDDCQPIVHYLLSKVSSTAVLASARTSSVPSSPPLAPPQFLKPSSAGGRRVSTLGFCVHTDFQPIEVSCSRKQLQLVANLVEGLLSTCFTIPASSTSADTTSGVPGSVPPTPGPDLKRTVSITSSSALDQVETESTPSESVSSTAFSQIQQPSNSIRVSLWLQWTLPRVVANLYSRSAVSNSAVCVGAELEDLTASIDYSETMLQMQYKVGAFNISHFEHSPDGAWVRGRFNGILFSCNDIISSKSLFTSTTRSSSGRREIPGPGPHGFLTVMYKRSSLHLKRRRSTSAETAIREEDYFKDQHEVRVNIQPFDVVLWCPAIVAALNTFDLSLLDRFKFLSESQTVVETAESVLLLKDDEGEESKQSVTVNIELLPLVFINMRNLRVFVPTVAAGKEVEVLPETGKAHFQEDITVVQLSTVCASPHPDNPNSRTVLNREFYEKFRKFGRSSRQALGYDIHDVQYQIDLCGFGVWTGSWGQLCGKLKHDDGLERVGIAVDQNPALEWNTQMWRGTEEVHVTPIISGSDFRIMLAPAISVEKNVTVKNTTVSENIQVCGWSLEFNVVTDVDCFLNKKQIQLLQTLYAENLKALSTCSLSVPSGQESVKSPADLRPDEVFQERLDRIDSGFESGRTNLTAKFSKATGDISNIGRQRARHNMEKAPDGKSEVPWEVFLTGRKLTAAVYNRIPLDEKPAEQELPSKPNLPGRGKSKQIKPVLRVELVHPALIVNTQSTGPRIQVSCFDVNVAGAAPSKGSIFKPLPDPSDYTVDWFKSGVGFPDPHSGILPSLATVDITNFLSGPADVSVELGRAVHLNFNLENVKELTEFTDGLVLPNEESLGAMGSQTGASGRTVFLRSFNLCTSDMFIQLDAPSPLGKPKLLGSVLGIEAKASLKPDLQGNLKRVDTRLQLHGVGFATSVYDRCRSLIHPFSCSIDLETVWAPHSRDLYVQSGCGLPQLYAVVEAGYVQVDVGQEHVTCLSLLADLAKQFTTPPVVQKETAEASTESTDLSRKVPEPVVLYQSFDDIRAGCFRYVTASGELDLHHPEPWEVVFTSDFSDRPPTMTWRYPEPRALSAVDLVPLPLSTPVLVNTLNMGDEYQVPCVLRYWDPTQKCYITYKDFNLSENNSTFIPLPDPSTAHPSEVIVAAEWQMVVDVTVDIDYPDDGSYNEDDTVSSYATPYRSFLSAASLAASVKVNSVVRPSLNPALSAQLNISILQVKFTNHLQAIGEAIPRHLVGFSMDPSLPTDQEFLLLTVEGLNAVVKDVGGEGRFLHVQTEWNCHAQVLDYGDLTYKPLLSPFDVGLTMTMYHEGRIKPPKVKDGPTGPPVWLDVSLEAGTVLTHVSQTTIHTIALSVAAWGQMGLSEAERIIFNHYIICNDTHEALRFGQVDTDESLLLGSRQVHAYSWRTPHTVKASPRLHVCIETEGDWRWSEQFDIDTVGVLSRTIHHRLHSATLFIEVKQLSGMQKQVIIRGSHIIVSCLSIDVDVQILTNPSLSSGKSPKARYQILEDVSLPANTALPSYVISHGGLTGMRIRIPNGTTWSDTLPLEHDEGEGKGKHLIVELLGVKEFQTFYFWYSVEKPGYPDQIKVSLSPLFVMRSHLPEPVLMNMLTAKTNSSSVLQLNGRAQEQQMYSLVPNSWHHLTFQFSGSGKWSSPSVPLNSTLIELANRMKNENVTEEEQPLADIWPYCRNHQNFRRSDIVLEEKPESSLVNNVSFAGHANNSKPHPDTQLDAPNQDMRGNPSPVPAIEVQCRVVKRWPHLSSLLVEVLPWCLLVNNTAVHLIVKDLERDVTVDLPTGSVVAPHRFTGKVQFGTYLQGKVCSWSEAVSFPSSSREVPLNDADDGLSVPVAFVLGSGEIRGTRWSVTSRTFRGIEVISIEQRFQVINNVGRPLLVHPVLVMTGKKMPSDNLNKATVVSLPSDHNKVTPIPTWDVPSSTAVVLNEEGNPSFNGQTSPVLFLTFQEEQYITGNKGANLTWSRAVFITPEVTRQSVAVSIGSVTLPLVVTSYLVDGIVNIVVSSDPSPRLLLQNDCPFTLQFGQAIPPQSPSHVNGSSEKIVVMEQMQGLGEIPDVAACSSTYYELPIMREWFATSSEVQKLPELHIQALYDVNVAEISEDESERGELAAEVTTEVPQGWSKGFDLNLSRDACVNLPGRGQVLISVSNERLCTCVKIHPYGEKEVRTSTVEGILPPPSVINVDFFICQFGLTVIDEVMNFRNPYEVFRLTAEGISVTHSVGRDSAKDSNNSHVCRELSLRIGAFQVDNQLQDDMYEFSVILTPSDTPMTPRRIASPKRTGSRSKAKPLVSIKCVYEPGTCENNIFLSSVNISLQPLTLYIEDSFLYRLGDMVVSFLPPALHNSLKSPGNASIDSLKVLNVTSPSIYPIVMGELKVTPVTLNVTLHGSAKLFISVDDSPLSLGQFHLSPVFLPSSALVQKLTHHYVTAALFKAGWVLGSLELLGNPAGLVRSFSQGVADFFYLPYDGLTRGPGAFVSGMSRGMSSFVRHLSTGALTSITSLASSMARNLDRLSMDGEHLRLLEEQRCRKPKKVLTGLSQGLGGFGLSLLGAVAGIVDQPIQGIRRANDVREAASGVITGVGKGLIGVVTKPLGGAMELVSQTGQGILQGAGLTQLPNRMFAPDEKLEYSFKNSHLKYCWKMLHNQRDTDLLLHLDATVVTSSGHDYDGTILLTRDTLFIVGSAVDAIQQTLLIRDIDLEEDEEDNRSVAIVNQSVITKEEGEESEGAHDSGDADRLRQFLRDARAQALEQMPSLDTSESSLTSPGQKFALLVDPMLRRTLVLQFQSAKRNLNSET